MKRVSDAPPPQTESHSLNNRPAGPGLPLRPLPAVKTRTGLIRRIDVARGAGPTQSERRSLAELIEDATAGFTKSQFELGLKYYTGDSVEKDFEKAFQWFDRAKDNYILAQFYLGEMYANGRGVGQDEKQAVTWYYKAARTGHVGARQFLENQAEQGNAEAQWYLGEMYYTGHGVEQDLTKAFQWCEKSANRRNADAQYRLATMYGLGKGVARDVKKMVEWVMRAAEQGHADALISLAKMYRVGEFVKRDQQKAVDCYRTAAENGHRKAQSALGEMYATGTGVEQDHPKAAYWLMCSSMGKEHKDEVIFNDGFSDEVIACMPEVLKNSSVFSGVTKFGIENFRLSQAGILAVDQLIRLNKYLEGISIAFDEEIIEEGISPPDLERLIESMSGAVREANTCLTQVEVDVDVDEAVRLPLDRMLKRNESLSDLCRYVEQLPLETSNDMPADLLRPLAEWVIVTNLLGDATKEATQEALDEFLMSARLPVSS